MNKKQVELLENMLGILLSEEKTELFLKYEKIFLEKNSRLNLISKNDEKLLFEKHIFDSLAFNLFLRKFRLQENGTLLDIGTGGGFPSVPLTILCENIQVYPLDSIRKKINAVEEIKSELGLKNLFPTCGRAEKLQFETGLKFDYVTTRAVASFEKILKYALLNLKPGGYFIAYKSKKARAELEEAKGVLKKSGAKVVDIIEYSLPTEELYERNLIIVQKTSSNPKNNINK